MNTKYKLAKVLSIPMINKDHLNNTNEDDLEGTEVALSSNVPTIIDVYIKDIFANINKVHEQATSKYLPYSWENEFTVDNDACPLCNLQAILRHTMRLYNNEWVNGDSNIPRIYHIYTRMQMYITSIMRMMNNDVSDKVPDPNINKKYPSYINDRRVGTDTKEAYSYITPEFIFSIANIVNKDIAYVASQYNILKDSKSVLRRFIIRLCEYLEFHQTNISTMHDIVSDNVDIPTYTKELLMEVIVVCSTLLYWKEA